jgi:hypothetical protein
MLCALLGNFLKYRRLQNSKAFAGVEGKFSTFRQVCVNYRILKREPGKFFYVAKLLGSFSYRAPNMKRLRRLNF